MTTTVTVVRCEDRHQFEGHLRTLAVAWPTRAPESRAGHGAAVVRLELAVRVFEQVAVAHRVRALLGGAR